MTSNNLVPAILLLLMGLALACPDYCNDCDPNGKICFACKQDYELSVLGKCVSNIVDKCIVYGPTNQCFVCQPSFELSGGKCVKQFSGCLRKNTVDNQCYECGFGKGLQNNFCYGSINCNTSSTTCDVCAPGFELKSDGNCYDVSAGCEKVGDNFGTCAKCKDGFKMMGYRCVREDMFVPYCYIYYNESACEICKNGYSFFQNYCLLPVHIQGILNGSTTIDATIAKIRTEIGVPVRTTTTTSSSTTTTTTTVIISNPTTTTSTTSSTNSNSNSNANANSNSNVNMNINANSNANSNINTNLNANVNANTNANANTPVFAPIPNCANQNNGVCLACNSGFVVSNNVCQQMDPNCGSYELTSGRCVSCISGFQFAANNGLCTPIPAPVPVPTVAKIANCEVTDPKTPTICLICTYGYFPSGNICAKVSRFCDGHNVQTGDCFACKFGFDLNNGKCFDRNCLSYGANQICASCTNGFRINSDGNCEYSDPNCVSFVNGRCDVCSQGWYPSAKGTCFKLPANCQFGNVINEGSCAQCLNGFSIQPNGSCTLIVQTITLPNCAIVQGNVCQTCNPGFFVKNGGCSQISKLCSGSNPSTGACVGCTTGYTLINGACFDLNCLNQADDRCVQCKANYQVSVANNLCLLVDPNCLNMGLTACMSCAQGYSVGVNGLCQKVVVVTPTPVPTPTVNPTTNTGTVTFGGNTGGSASNSGSTTSTTTTTTTGGGAVVIINDPNRDPNCKDYSNGKCNTCSNRYYVGLDGKCIPVNAYCDGYNTMTGACTSCYKGFSLSNGNCIPTAQDDPYCKNRNPVTNNCLECYSAYWLNGTKCTPVNPLCATSNLQNGQCLTCYPGYSLMGGSCGVSFKDPNCQEYNSVTSTCNKCALRYFYDQLKAKCIPVNILCQDYNAVTGACASCFTGYKLVNGDCTLSTASNSDVNCKTLSANGGCLECYNGYFVKAGKCEKLNLLCATSNMVTGICLSCYQGYTLTNGDCVLGVQEDTNCKEFYDRDRKQCKTCYDQFYLRNNVCTKLNDLCKTSNKMTGACLDCYQGYTLISGDCVIALQTAASASSDVYCIKWNGTECVSCSSGFFYSQSSGKCQQTDPLCKTTNLSSGICVECYQGYVLSGNSCVIPVIVQIPFCQVTSAAGTCADCIDNYYLKNGACTPVSILCGGKYNKVTGQCTGCADGYFLQGGDCIYPAMGVDPACERYGSGGFCEKCSLGFYLLNFKCTQIDNWCTKFDYTRTLCLECFNKTPQGAGCV